MQTPPRINNSRVAVVSESIASLPVSLYESVYRAYPLYKVLEKLYRANGSPQPLLVIGVAISLISYAPSGDEDYYWDTVIKILEKKGFRLSSFWETWLIVEELLGSRVSSRFRGVKEKRVKKFYSKGLAEYLWFEAPRYYADKPLLVWYKITQFFPVRPSSKSMLEVLRVLDMTGVIEKNRHVVLEDEVFVVDKTIALVSLIMGVVEYDVKELKNLVYRTGYSRIIINTWRLIVNKASRLAGYKLPLLVIDAFLRKTYDVINECKQSIGMARACLQAWLQEHGVSPEIASSFAKNVIYTLF